MKEFYCEFKTWKEGSIELPWKFRIIGEINDYRNKNNPIETVNKATLMSIFLSFNEEITEKFLAVHIPALIVGMITPGNNEEDVIQQISKYLGPIEIDGIIEITENNQNQIFSYFNT